MKQLFIILFVMLLSLAGCGGQNNRSAVESNPSPKAFTVPEVPTLLSTAEQRAEFVVTHYWDNFDFADTTLISRADYTEQAFADFVNILPSLTQPLIEKGVETMMNRATADSAMYSHFMELSEKYLYDPNSPLRNEEIYIVVLQNIVGNSKLDAIYKVRPQYQLDMALNNRVGHKATDFTYTTPKGGKARLYDTKADKILLFFFRPDCENCKETKEYIDKRGIDKLVTMVWVNPDKDTHIDSIYDLRASPTLYLLDKDKTVLLKDVPIEQIETY